MTIQPGETLRDAAGGLMRVIYATDQSAIVQHRSGSVEHIGVVPLAYVEFLRRAGLLARSAPPGNAQGELPKVPAGQIVR